ncbi:MAG TPA: carboxypeptidase-like regulatory domain-containing protein [bacterium]|nr:carboxypeptidase-like regulatory domain-containing protein [bacterium]
MKRTTCLAIASAMLLWACGDETEHKPATDTDQVVVTDNAVTDNVVTDDTVTDETMTDDDICKCDYDFGPDTDEITDDTEPDETPDIDNGNCFNLGTTYNKGDLDDVATGISLAVRSNGWGTLLDTLTMDTEGTITLNVPEENPYYGETPSYFIYETANGFFTRYAYAEFGDTITVDLDPVMPDNLINGNLFMVQHYFGPTALANTAITVTDTNGATIGCFTTDGTGRFIINLPAGDYKFQFTDMDMMLYDEAVSTTGPGDYLDLRIMAEAQVDKPNIYLYPPETIDVSVTLGFPQGGFVTTSIPAYGDGWEVTVTPDGIVDDVYGYLFYEAQTPDLSQYREGWTIATEELEQFFRGNLAAYGFAGREIEDFIDWWIPRLTDGPCYDIYPQTSADIDPLITLDIIPAPDSVQRLFYTVRATGDCAAHLDTPVIESFIRDGFTVLEWGVILK